MLAGSYPNQQSWLQMIVIITRESFVFFLRERIGRLIDAAMCGEMHLYLASRRAGAAWSHAAGKTRARTAARPALVFLGAARLVRIVRNYGCCVGSHGGDWGWPLRWCHPVCHSAALIDLIAVCVCGIKLCAHRQRHAQKITPRNNARDGERVMRERDNGWKRDTTCARSSKCCFDWRRTWFFWHHHFYLWGLKVSCA